MVCRSAGRGFCIAPADNTQAFSGIVSCDVEGFLAADRYTPETPIDRVFASLCRYRKVMVFEKLDLLLGEQMIDPGSVPALRAPG